MKDTTDRFTSDTAVFIKSYSKNTHKTSECTVITLTGKIYKDARITDLMEWKGFWKSTLHGTCGALLIGFIAGSIDSTGECL